MKEQKAEFFRLMLDSMDFIDSFRKDMKSNYEIYNHIKNIKLNTVDKSLLKKYFTALSFFKDINSTNFIFQAKDWNSKPKEKSKLDILKDSCKKELDHYSCSKCHSKLYYNGKMVHCKNCDYFKSFKNYIKDQLK